MTRWQPTAERDRAIATVFERQHQLWRAQEEALRADALLRRAIRTVEEAEVSLGDASRRLARIDAFVARAGPASIRPLAPVAPSGLLRLLA